MPYRRMSVFCISYIIGLFHHKTVHTTVARDQHITTHYESGTHDKELAAITQRVKIQFSLPALHDKQVILFDIDDTALSCYPFFKHIIQHGYVWDEYLRSASMDTYYEFLRSTQLPAFTPIRELYQHFIDLGYKVIFLTARKDHVYDVTLKNLHAAGYTDFECLIMYAEQDSHLNGADFKEQARIRLAEKGYEILCTLDDINHNLQGAHVGYAVKIPNYLLEA